MITNSELIAAVFLLGVFWILDSLILVGCRRFAFSDFIGHLFTGAIFGGLSLIFPHQIFAVNLSELFTNPLLNSFSNLGLFLFFLLLGFNLDGTVLRLSLTKNFKKLVLLFCLNIFILGLGVFLFVKPNPISAFIFVIAFLGINVGPLLSGLFMENPSFKKYSKDLLQFALILDIVAFILFVILDSYLRNRYFATSLLKWGSVVLLVGITLLISLLNSSARSPKKLKASITAVGRRWVVGGLFVFLAIGMYSPVSSVLLAVWLGALLRTIVGNKTHLIRKQLYNAASLFIVLPFLQIGYEAVSRGTSVMNFWLFFFVILILWIVVNFLYGILLNRLENIPILMTLGIFPKGDLTVLLLWLGYRLDLFPATVLAAAVMVVLFTAFLGQYLFVRPLKSEELV